MWQCVHCGSKDKDRPTMCPSCGLVQAGKGTHEKYQILREYCTPLSLIMRNNNIQHWFIDACAGSAYVQSYERNELVAGSPIIMAETRNQVEQKIRDKSKTNEVNCVFIEVNQKTFRLLAKWTNQYSDFCERVYGDCNIKLESVLDKLDSELYLPFAFVYVDPFGLGEPVISKKTIERILERPYTELFLHFSLWGVERPLGQALKQQDSSNVSERRKAKSMLETLFTFMGGKEWIEEWARLEGNPNERRKRLLEWYESSLRQHYGHIEHIEIPIGSAHPAYYLIFTTRNQTGAKIMRGIMDRKRRRGSKPLEEWFV